MDAIDFDFDFDFRLDTPLKKDPDSHSATMRAYHKILWSKPLPNGIFFDLTDKKKNAYLYHQSNLGEYYLSSDTIAHSYNNQKKMSHIVEKVDPNIVESYIKKAYGPGGIILFPSRRVQNKMTINGARGTNSKIADRFDLTLECIRLFYANENSPLREVLERYREFFSLFQNFQGYVDFFMLNDLTSQDYKKVNFFLPFDNFERPPLPATIEEYLEYKSNSLDFVTKRCSRLENWYKCQNSASVGQALNSA